MSPRAWRRARRVLARAGSSDVPPVRGDPIRRDQSPRPSERDSPCADPVVQHTLERVLRIRRPASLGPEVPQIERRAAELERDQVVELVAPEAMAGVVAVGADQPALDRLGDRLRRSDGPRPAALADGLPNGSLRHAAVDGAGSASMIREHEQPPAGYTTMRGDRSGSRRVADRAM